MTTPSEPRCSRPSTRGPTDSRWCRVTRTSGGLGRSSARKSRGSRSVCWRSGSRRATASASGRRTAPSGRSCSSRARVSARSSSTSTPRTARASSRTRSAHSGVRLLVTARAVQDVRLPRRCSRRCATSSPRSSGSSRSTAIEPAGPTICCGRELRRGGARSRRASSLREREARARRRRPDQHPVHERHDRATRRARRSRTTTSSTTRTRSPGCSGYTDADRVCIPVPLYHCFGMGVGNLGLRHDRRDDGVSRPRRSSRWRRSQAVAEERCTSLYGVPTMLIAQLEHPRFAEFDLTSLRTGIMAGSPCPIEVMKRAVSDMHASEVCIVYGMTETAPVSFITRRDDDLERRVSTVGTCHAQRRGQDRRPRHRRDGARGHAGRGLHARLRRDARLLGGPRRRPRTPSTPAAGCTPATSA